MRNYDSHSDPGILAIQKRLGSLMVPSHAHSMPTPIEEKHFPNKRPLTRAQKAETYAVVLAVGLSALIPALAPSVLAGISSGQLNTHFDKPSHDVATVSHQSGSQNTLSAEGHQTAVKAKLKTESALQPQKKDAHSRSSPLLEKQQGLQNGEPILLEKGPEKPFQTPDVIIITGNGGGQQEDINKATNLLFKAIRSKQQPLDHIRVVTYNGTFSEVPPNNVLHLETETDPKQALLKQVEQSILESNQVLHLVLIGHGFTDQSGNYSFTVFNRTGQEDYPYDYYEISTEELGNSIANALIERQKQGKNELDMRLLVESCYSGGLVIGGPTEHIPPNVHNTSISSAVKKALERKGGSKHYPYELNVSTAIGPFYQTPSPVERSFIGAIVNALDDGGPIEQGVTDFPTSMVSSGDRQVYDNEKPPHMALEWGVYDKTSIFSVLAQSQGLPLQSKEGIAVPFIIFNGRDDNQVIRVGLLNHSSNIADTLVSETISVEGKNATPITATLLLNNEAPTDIITGTLQIQTGETSSDKLLVYFDNRDSPSFAINTLPGSEFSDHESGMLGFSLTYTNTQPSPVAAIVELTFPDDIRKEVRLEIPPGTSVLPVNFHSHDTSNKGYDAIARVFDAATKKLLFIGRVGNTDYNDTITQAKEKGPLPIGTIVHGDIKNTRDQGDIDYDIFMIMPGESLLFKNEGENRDFQDEITIDSWNGTNFRMMKNLQSGESRLIGNNSAEPIFIKLATSVLTDRVIPYTCKAGKFKQIHLPLIKK